MAVEMDGTTLLQLSLRNQQDREPLRMVSGEQLRYWLAIEQAAREVANYRHTGLLQCRIDSLAQVLNLPSLPGQCYEPEDDE